MSEDWRLVAVGFAIASLGAGATALYIVGMSWLYVGRFSPGGLALVGASLGAIAFRRTLGPYLDALDARVEDGTPEGDRPLRP
jgi:hypothetical protein